MDEQFTRTIRLIGQDQFEILKNAKILVVGIGGVGGYVVEMLARCGIGTIDLVDNDKISMSNINRQIIATMDTIDAYKVDAMKKRILSINPKCNVHTLAAFLLKENMDTLHFENYDYVVDAIDTVSTKLAIIEKCNQVKTPIISSMGTGNKLHPERLEITDISKTSVCPLARVMRYELRKRGIQHVKVCYSKEEPIQKSEYLGESNKPTPASIAFVPSVAGIFIASAVVNDLLNTKKETVE